MHGAGGVLLQHKKVITTSCAADRAETPYLHLVQYFNLSCVKELMLHCDMHEGDKMQVIYHRPIDPRINTYIYFTV